MPTLWPKAFYIEKEHPHGLRSVASIGQECMFISDSE